jgi:hypothetical protein
MVAWRFLPLLAVAGTLALSPAEATVTFNTAGASSQTRGTTGGPDVVRDGTPGLITDVSAQQVTSRSDLREERFQTRVIGSSAGAVQFTDPADARLFLRTSVDAQSAAHQLSVGGAATASAYYNFSVDTESALSFTTFTSADITINLFTLTALGEIDTYLRLGGAGSGSESYTLAPGSYGFSAIAFSQASIAANQTFNDRATSSNTVNVSLSIVSPAAPVSDVPEPATWAMMIVGFGAIGVASRRRNFIRRTA